MTSRRSTRLPIAIALILSLIATALLRGWSSDVRTETRRHSQYHPIGGDNADAPDNAAASLQSLKPYATALLLGGFRGPLVMILWHNSETQKAQHDLQDVDTEIEWIRILQPEFDSVHLFQIWNKAYNLSAQMSSNDNKYACVIDGINYGIEVDRQRPDDMNILAQMAQIYEFKLGQSQEHVYYRRRFRHESLTPKSVQFPAAQESLFTAQAGRLGWIAGESPIHHVANSQTDLVLLEAPIAQRLTALVPGLEVIGDAQIASDTRGGRLTRIDPLLTSDGFILPNQLVPRYPRPADLPAGELWYDGSALQFLKTYQPFPYGISPLAMSYNYYERARLLQMQWNETPLQIGGAKIDDSPGQALALWANDEWERGRRFELRMWNQSVPLENNLLDLEQPAAATRPTEPTTDTDARKGALFSYALAARLLSEAHADFLRHVQAYPTDAATYYSHFAESDAGTHFMSADLATLQIATALAADRRRLIQSAMADYQYAAEQYALMELRFYVEDDAAEALYPTNPATGKPYTRLLIASADPSVWLATFDKFNDAARHNPSFDQHPSERDQYGSYITRCETRFRMLQGMLSEVP